MKVPNGERAIVDERKVTEYLLSPSHSNGRFKARFFRALGFRPEQPEALASELRRLAREGEVANVEDNPYGKKYRVVGDIVGPDGSAKVAAVWFVSSKGGDPSLVTAFPE